MHKYQNRISKENFQTSRSSNFKHDLTRRQGVNILLVRTVHEQTELSLKPRRALAGIEFSFHEREKEGMNREDSFEFSFTADHSQDRAENFTDHSPPTTCSPVSSRFIPSVHLPDETLIVCSLSYRGRPTDSHFSENFLRQRADRIDFTNITKRNSQHCPP